MMPDQFGLSLTALGQLRAVFRAYPAIKKVVLYGSRAKGNFRPGSDIDLCLDAPSLELTTLLAIENQLDDLLLPWKIDLCLKHKIDNPALLEHIERVGLDFFSD